MKLNFIATLSLSLLLYFTPAGALEYTCPNQPEVIIHASSAEEVEDICVASERAVIFLFHLDLLPLRTIHIELTETPITAHGNLAYGSYDSRRDTITLMSYSSILHTNENPQIFGEFFDRVHYGGAIAHEVAHAIIQHNVVSRSISILSQEYLAYATQLRVLPAYRRKVILQRMNVDGWAVGDAISETYLSIGPDRFAAKSFIHLNSLPDPTIFVKILLGETKYYVNVPDLKNIQIQ